MEIEISKDIGEEVIFKLAELLKSIKSKLEEIEK